MSFDELMVWIGERSERDEATGCLNWQRAMSHGIPKANLPGQRSTVNVRRVLIERKLGRPLGAGMLASYSCGNLRCMEPEHQIEMTRAAVQQRSSAEGKFSSEKFRAGQKNRKKREHAFIERIGAANIREMRELSVAGKLVAHIARDSGHHKETVKRVLRGDIGGHLRRPCVASSVFQWGRR